MSTRKRRQKEVEEEESSPLLDKNQDDDDDDDEEAPPRSKDAPSELAVDRIVDMIDFEIEHILWERMSRKDHFESLEWFWKWFPGNEVDKGCRFIRRLMAHILTHSCACHPYGLKKDENNEGGDDDMEPLVNWDASQWQGLRDSFELLRTLMLRKDATINYLGKDQLLPDGEDVDEEREQTSLFTKSFRLIMDQIEIHRIISPIRNALEVQTRKMGKKSIGKKRLTEVWNEMRSLDDKSIVKEALLNLFELVESGKGDDSEEEGKPKRKIPTDLPKLKSLSDLKLILQDPPFDLCKLQISVERILHRFNQIVTGGEDCALIKARYTIPEGSSLYHTLESSHAARVAESSARRSKLEREVEGSALEDLRRRSADLKSSERHGEDPLKKAVRVAKRARPAAEESDDDDEEEDEAIRSNLQRRAKERKDAKRKRRPKLTIVEELEEEEEEEEKAAAKLSKIPKRLSRSTEKGDIPPDEGIFDSRGKVVKRRAWTEQEKFAVKEGVKKYGVGRWTIIKEEYSAILHNRKPVQIKDCWRTMVKNEEAEA